MPDWLTHNDGEEVSLFKVEQVRGDTGILGLWPKPYPNIVQGFIPFFQVENLALSRLRQAAKKNPPEAEKVFCLFLFTQLICHSWGLIKTHLIHPIHRLPTDSICQFVINISCNMVISQGNGVGSNLIPLIGSPGARARVVSGGNRRWDIYLFWVLTL